MMFKSWVVSNICDLKNKTCKGDSEKEKQKKNSGVEFLVNYTQKLLMRRVPRRILGRHPQGSHSSSPSTVHASFLYGPAEGFPHIPPVKGKKKVDNVATGSSPWKSNNYYYVNLQIKPGKEFWGWKAVKGTKEYNQTWKSVFGSRKKSQSVFSCWYSLIEFFWP